MTKTKTKHLLTWQRLLALFALCILVVLSVVRPLNAQDVTQGYGTDQPLQTGMLVQIKKSDTTKVEAVKFESIDQMHGVVVDSNDAPVTLSNEGQKVFIATAGKYSVLVSNQAGNINPGDYVTISALPGVGMKAGTKEPLVAARALEGFNGSNAIGTTEITDSTGQKRTVKFARIAADISVSRNPLQKGEAPNVPEFLRKASEVIAGKPVNATRIYLSLFVFAVSTLASASLLYAGVRNGLISIGRNPLSRKMIIKSMFQVIITGLIIFITGLFGVYLLLKL